MLSAYSKPHKLPANFTTLNLLRVFNHLAKFLPSGHLTNLNPVLRPSAKNRSPPQPASAPHLPLLSLFAPWYTTPKFFTLSSFIFALSFFPPEEVLKYLMQA
jgi:hypothetical protein